MVPAVTWCGGECVPRSPPTLILMRSMPGLCGRSELLTFSVDQVEVAHYLSCPSKQKNGSPTFIL